MPTFKFLRYSICIRPAEGYCCVLYQVCSDPSSYTLSAEDTAEAKIGTNCATDWLEIAGIHRNKNSERGFDLIFYGKVDLLLVTRCPLEI